jgi:hypothetical protein
MKLSEKYLEAYQDVDWSPKIYGEICKHDQALEEYMFLKRLGKSHFDKPTWFLINNRIKIIREGLKEIAKKEKL